MTLHKTIRGLSGAGFRIPNVSGGYSRVTENTSVVVDLDDVKTQLILAGERDNFIRTREAQTFTVTSATPAVFTSSGHGLSNGDIIILSTTGALYTGLTAGTKYYVISAASNTFEVATTFGGSAVNTSGSQSGTHTWTAVSSKIAGITRGRSLRIKDTSGTLVDVSKGQPVSTPVVQVDLTDGDTKRVLRRSYGRYVYVGAAGSSTSLAIRGIQLEQNGFEVPTEEGGSLLSNNTNVSNADAVTVASKTYTFKTNLTEAKATDTVATSGTPASVRATGTITTSGTGAANNDTVTVGGVTYTFKTTLTGAANEVLRTGVEDVDITNLVSAINATSGSGTTYGTGTVANPAVTAGAMASHATVVTAISYNATVGNAIALAKTGSVISVSAAALAGGTNETVNVDGQTYTFVETLDAGTANEVLINGQDTSLTNLASAINGTAGAGTTYGTGTVANTHVSAGAVTSHTITLTALAVGTAANAYTLAKTGSHVSVGAGTFSGGLDSVANEVKIGGSADASLVNLGEAINGTPNAGTDFSSATTANGIVTANTTITAHTLSLTVAAEGYDVVALTTTAATLTPTAFAGGISKVYRGVTATVNPQDSTTYQQLRRFYKKYVEA